MRLPFSPTMKIALVSNLDTGMMHVIDAIKEKAMSLNVGTDITPVNRIIDIPMAVRRMGERPDIDSVLIAVDFPELAMEHDAPLVESIKAEVSAIGQQIGKPVSMELMDAKIGELDVAKIDDVLKGLVEEDTANSF